MAEENNEDKLTEVMITIKPGGELPIGAPKTMGKVPKFKEVTEEAFEQEVIKPITIAGSKGVSKLKGIVKGLKGRDEITLEKDWNEIATSISNAFNKNMSKQIIEKAKQEGPGFWKRLDSALDVVAMAIRKAGGRISRSKLAKFFKDSLYRQRRAFDTVKQAHKEAQK
jgi:hypothetical protein